VQGADSAVGLVGKMAHEKLRHRTWRGGPAL
jgi:hypothetical protein